MGLMKIQGEQVPVSRSISHKGNYDAPALLLSSSGRCEFRTLAIRLASVTGMRDEMAVEAVRQASDTAAKPDKWSKEDALRVLSAVGWTAPPRLLDVVLRKGQGIVTFRVPEAKGPDTQEVIYPPKKPRAKVDLESAMSMESITVPRGMYQVIPVALGEDEKGVVLFANLRKGELHSIKELAQEDAASAASQSAPSQRKAVRQQDVATPDDMEADEDES